MMRVRHSLPLALLSMLLWCSAHPASGQESPAQSAERLAKLTDAEKESLRKKKEEFAQLSIEQQQRLRDLHTAIAREPESAALLETATRYTRWLENLDPLERSTLNDIKDPQQRIVRIKQIMKQQEERRFQQYAFMLPEDDLNAIYKWLGEWVTARGSEIRERLPRDVRQRIDDAPDEDSRRRGLVDGWQRALRYTRLPTPNGSDYHELLSRFSTETQGRIASLVARDLAAEPEAERPPERQRELTEKRLEYLAQTALFSRFFPVVSQTELLKFYDSMKADDPRRQRLEGKENEELRRELQRMYNWERMMTRGGGPPSGPGGPPGGPGSRGLGSSGPGWVPPGWGPPPGPPRGEGRGEGRGGRSEERRGEGRSEERRSD